MNDFLVAVLIASDRNREGDMADREIGLQIGIIASAFISNIMETAVVTDELPELIVKLVLFLIITMGKGNDQTYSHKRNKHVDSHAEAIPVVNIFFPFFPAHGAQVQHFVKPGAPEQGIET